jgi:predicted  nucleic acid-binding Zn-ribbon protein
MNDPTTDDNPLSVDQAMALIGKWETHPGLLTAIFDASRKLRDEVEQLRDNNVTLMTKIGDLGKKNSALQTELQQGKKFTREVITDLEKNRDAMQTELDQLRAVVAQNNQSIAAILSRWIKPSTN